MDIKINSLGYRTDFIFNKFDGSITDKGDYIVATTKSNPNYFWGNLLLYKSAPKKGDLKRWKADFISEIVDPRTYHITLAWDSPQGDQGDISEFIDDGFELESSVVLTARKVVQPRKYNDEVELKIIGQDDDFRRCIEVQVACANDKLSKNSWADFYQASMAHYKRMIEAGRGQWFGAVINDKIVGSLGVFTDDKIGRFQIVSTDPEFQRRGVCSTLVYKASQYAFEQMGAETLVMVADEDYHAAKIYESVGFLPTEKQVGLCWWDKTRHG